MIIAGKFRWRPTLRRRLLIAISGTHLVLMLLFVSDLTNRQQQFILERGRDRTAYDADFLAASATQQMVTRDYAGLQDLIASASADQTIRFVSIHDETGKIIAHSDTKRIGMYYTDERARRALAGPPRRSIVYETEQYIHAVAPVRMEGEFLGWTWVAKDLSAELAAISEVRERGFKYLLMATIIGSLSALLIAHGITRQLRALTAGAQRLVANRLDTAVPILSKDEVGDLAIAFNSAMRELAAYQATIERSRQVLAVEVAERTRAQSELQRANDALVAANDSLGQFAYAASHDLQEPLRSVALYSQLLERRYKGTVTGEGEQFLAFIHAGAVRMQNLIVALLEYSRAGGRSDAPTEIVDCRKALGAAMENLKVALEHSGAQVDAGELGFVKAHEIAIVQLFQNLIGNAIKYTAGEPPRIRIWSEAPEHEDCLHFAVQDNGIGIAPADHERVFAIFKRVHGDKYAGTGVGLAICKKLVERYGGRIWVESEPGRGSTFRFTLPEAHTANSIQRTERPPAPPDPDGLRSHRPSPLRSPD